MENFTMLIQGFGTALTPMNIGVCHAGRNPGTGRRRDAWYWFPGRSCSSSASDLQI